MINEKILKVHFFHIDKIFLYDLNYKKSFKLKYKYCKSFDKIWCRNICLFYYSFSVLKKSHKSSF